MVIENAQFIMESVVTEIKPMKLPQDFFLLEKKILTKEISN